MKRLLALLLALIMVLGLAACGQKEENPVSEEAPAVEETPAEEAPVEEAPAEEETADPEAERYGGEFTLVWTPGDTFDPMKTSGWKSYAWAMNVYEGPICRDAEGKLAPAVCDFELSDDNLTLTLWVREGVTFHDGSPVEIEDVLASIQRASGTVSRMKNHYVPFVKSETISGDKLVIEFTEYDINTLWYFAANQTWNVVLPKEICEKYGTENAIIDVADAIGTGPYKLVEGEPGIEMVMERYDGYVAVPEGRTGVAAPKKAYLDTIKVIAASDDNTDAMKLISGEVDFISRNNDLDDLYVQGGMELVSCRDSSMLYFNFNCSNEARPVNDANVRKAIAAALDYEELGKFYMGDLYEAVYSPVTGAYTSEIYANADYHGAANVELAKEYLAASDYAGEEVVFLIGTDQTDLSPFVKERLSAAGINIKVEYMDSTAMSEYVLNTENPWDMCFNSSTVVDMPSTIATAFISDSWTNEEKDAVMAILGTTPVASEESLAAWEQLDAILAEECPDVLFGKATSGTFAKNPDLVWNFNEGTWRHWWNSYWTNPAEH